MHALCLGSFSVSMAIGSIFEVIINVSDEVLRKVFLENLRIYSGINMDIAWIGSIPVMV